MAKTLDARLAAVVAAFPPVRPHTDKEGSPYQIITIGDTVRIHVTNADGDRIGGVGASLDEAVSSLEKKVNVTTE
jgi:hypothetical protein